MAKKVRPNSHDHKIEDEYRPDCSRKNQIEPREEKPYWPWGCWHDYAVEMVWVTDHQKPDSENCGRANQAGNFTL
jgi:hypothetical protein